MSSSRWDPWGEMISLREAMSNLLEESVVSHRPPGAGNVLGLAIDVRETATAYVLTASVPGVKPDELSITLLGDTVRISGERREDRSAAAPAEAGRWLIRERHFGPFDRTLKVPTAIAVDAAAASFEDGVLTVTLPKANDVQPRTISVRPGSVETRAIEVEGGAAAHEE